MKKEFNNKKRMVLEKFNNRPPFNIKNLNNTNQSKIDEMICTDFDISSSDVLYLDGARQSYVRIVPKNTSNISPSPNTVLIKKNTVIPKVLKNFKDVVPKKERQVFTNSNTTSLTNSSKSKENEQGKIGKNIPNHNLMRTLLSNLNLEKPGQCGDCLIKTNDVMNVSSSKNTWCSNHNFNKPIRVDKKTSTSGLFWTSGKSTSTLSNQVSKSEATKTMPSNELTGNEIVKAIQKARSKKKVKDGKLKKYQAKKKVSSKSTEQNYSTNSHNIYSSPSDYTTQTMDVVPQTAPNKRNKTGPIYAKIDRVKLEKENKRNYEKLKDSLKQFEFEFSQSEDISHPKSIRHDGGDVVETEHSSRSFVRAQVQKYDQLTKSHSKNGKVNKKTSRAKKGDLNNSRVSVSKRRSKSPNLNCKLIASIREKVIQYQENSSVVSKTSETQNWSDSSDDRNYPIKFPKETKTAMDVLLEKRKSQAVVVRQKSSTKNIPPPPAMNMDVIKKRSSQIHSNRSLKDVPCIKNLLCDRGIHNGFCARNSKKLPSGVADRLCFSQHKRRIV